MLTAVNIRGDIRINPTTGEILEDGEYLEPLDVSTLTSRKEYDRQIKKRLRKSWRLMVSPLLLDLVVEKEISIPALSIFCLLGRSVGLNNMVYCNTAELVEGSGYTRQTVSKVIQELIRDGYLRESGNKMEVKGEKLYFVNPLYFFLGYYPYREQTLKEWWRDIGVKGNVLEEGT